MSAPSSAPQALDETLLGLGDEAMLIDELDGFLTGILVCPDLILPRDWFHHIWGHGGPEEIAPFEDKDSANRFLSLVMDHYNGIAAALNEGPGCFEPVVSEDTNSGEVLWELWIAGFARAVSLRPKAFGSLLGADAQTAAAFARLLFLEAIADGEYKGEESEISAAIEGAHAEIGGLIDTLHAWRLKSGTSGVGLGLGPNPFAATSGHIGRNDPCPCGSGKKYKKCCGLN